MTREAFEKAVVINHQQDGSVHKFKATLTVTAVEYIDELKISESFEKSIRDHLLNNMWYHIFEDRRHLACEALDEYMRYHHPMCEYDKANQAREKLMKLIAWK